MTTELKAATRLLVTKQELQDAEHQGVLDETGYWGKRGAGCIIMAADTQRILLPLRSSEVTEPGTWGTWGGAIDGGENPAVSVRREVKEEAGYHGKVSLYPLLVFKDPDKGFQYNNYLAVVPSEFTPSLNWETERAQWFEFGKWPRPLHPGLKTLIHDAESLKTIRFHMSK